MNDPNSHLEDSSSKPQKAKFRLGPFSLLEIITILCIISFFMALLYPAIQATRNPKGPNGEIIPAEPPDESNRVSDLSGLSIIAPRNWDKDEQSFTESRLRIFARVSPLRRAISIISIYKCNKPNAKLIKPFKNISFHNYPAYELTKIKRKYGFDDPAWSTYDLFINRNGEWWWVSIGIADEITSLPKGIQQYIDTIIFPDIDVTQKETKQKPQDK